MKSFKQMRNSGELVRADAEKIDYRSIHIEPGFNPEGRTEEEEADDEELYAYIEKHGVNALPQLEVRPREEDGVFIVDGHRRYKQIGRAISNGVFKPDDKGRYLVGIKQFAGNDLQRLYRIGTSNKSKGIKPLQFSELCVRARDGFGESIESIAAGFLCSTEKVRQALILAGANHDVQQMVKNGEVSKTTAVRVVKDKGDKAGDVLKAAKKEGKQKVTSKDVEGSTPADLVKAIEQEMASNGMVKAETLVPKYAKLIAYLRGE